MRHSATDLTDFAERALTLGGMAAAIARDTAEILVEGDLLGHSTHGLQLLGRYLEELRSGALRPGGVPVPMADSGAGLTWDGGYLPGPHLMRLAMREGARRAGEHSVVTLVLRRSGHIGCLAAYALALAERGFLAVLASSDPAVEIVAPHGAAEARLTPNPIAAGWPTEGDPVFLDVCPSSTTAGMVGRAARRGERLGGDWVIGPDEEPSDDPAAVTERGGAILPLGGLDLGHKGFALALLVEALTAGLGGFGRANEDRQSGAAVWLMIVNPEGFGGGAAFRHETEQTAQLCRTARPIPGGKGVRLPGARGLALKREQLRDGIALHPDTVAALGAIAAETGLPLPPAREEG